MKNREMGLKVLTVEIFVWNCTKPKYRNERKKKLEMEKRSNVTIQILRFNTGG